MTTTQDLVVERGVNPKLRAIDMQNHAADLYWGAQRLVDLGSHEGAAAVQEYAAARWRLAREYVDSLAQRWEAS